MRREKARKKEGVSESERDMQLGGVSKGMLRGA